MRASSFSLVPTLLLATLLGLAGCATAPDEQAGAGAGASAAGEAEIPGVGGVGGIGVGELPPGVAPGSQEDLEITVGDRVFFGYDSAVLDQQATNTLDRQAVWLQRYPDITVTIEGHADERGTREYNLALGDRRATSVRNYLIALDIPPSRINAISYGEERPAVDGRDEAAWAKNRRAVTVVATPN